MKVCAECGAAWKLSSEPDRKQPPWFYLEDSPRALAERAAFEAAGGDINQWYYHWYPQCYCPTGPWPAGIPIGQDDAPRSTRRKGSTNDRS